jgi:hypothetical protein
VNLLLQFAYLQVLDALTTLAFLMNRVREANPLIRFLMSAGPSPLAGLLAVKLVAFGMAVYCVKRARLRLLKKVNVLFAGLIVWNLCVLIISAP